ncbi:MAG: type VI secretion system lipoprotein TssJ [Rhodocyclaceae bacterium]
MVSRGRLFGPLAVTVSVAAAVAGCASPPPKPPPPTIVQASVEVAPNVNPDSRGRASPIVVKVFELKTLATFNSADFFSLFEKDKDALGAELLARDELQLKPKDSRKFERTMQPDTRYVGVIAGFRDLERANWRAAVAVPLQQTTPVTIRVDARSISITAKP